MNPELVASLGVCISKVLSSIVKRDGPHELSLYVSIVRALRPVLP